MLRGETEGLRDAPACARANTPGRSIDAILARRRARLRARRESFAPGFLHGRVPIDVGYRELGQAWMEQVFFVDEIRDKHGVLQAWTAGWFDDHILTIEQGVREEVDDLKAKLEEHYAARRTVIRLRVDEHQPATEQGRVIDINTSRERLITLERSRLGVVRDKVWTDREAFEACTEEVLADSQTSLLSLICLCALLRP